MEHRCPKCGELCLSRPSGDRTAAAGAYSVTIRGIPFFSCPRGCVIDQPDMGNALFPFLKLLGQLSHAVARKKGFFRKRLVCRECGEELVSQPAENRWNFVSPPIEIAVAGPGLFCARCQKAFLPDPVDIQRLGQTLTGLG